MGNELKVYLVHVIHAVEIELSVLSDRNVGTYLVLQELVTLRSGYHCGR